AAPPMRHRLEALCERAARDPATPAEALAVAGMLSLLTNERAEIGAELVTRALLTVGSTLPGTDGRPWFSSGMFARATLSLVWAERSGQVETLFDDSIPGAGTTGDGVRFAVGLASRAWLALKRGDPRAAELDTRTALAATELPAPPLYRVMNGGVLVNALVDQGALDAAEQALASFDSETQTGFVPNAALRVARGRLRLARGRLAPGADGFL